MTILQRLIKIEDAYDQRNMDEVDGLCELDYREINSFFKLMYDDKFHEAADFGKQLFYKIKDNKSSVELKTFILYWTTAAIEMNFNETIRNEWLLEWNQLEAWTYSPWCALIHKYQIALSKYFQNSYRESLAIFEQMFCESERIKYKRGMERSLFHQALIYRNIGLWQKAEIFLKEASALANKRNSIKMIERINLLQSSLCEQTWSLNGNIRIIEDLMRLKQYRAARKQLLFVCKLRRIEKRSWGAESEVLYLALLALAFQKTNRFIRLYKHIQDPQVREKVVSFALKYELTLPPNIESELTYLRQTLGINGVSLGRASELFGKKISKIKNKDIVSFLKLISESENGCDKENLCKKIWNYDYDPTIHDPKIYKLVYKTKNELGLKDIIVVSDGSYRINEKYIL